MSAKQQVTASIEEARAVLEQALKDIHQVPDLDWGTVRYTVHALGNYLNIIAASVWLLRAAVDDHSDTEAHGMLDNLERTTDLMTHLTRHLSHASATREVPLLSEEVDLGRMARRGCAFYQLSADHKRIQITCEVQDAIGTARADRLGVATILDNLLSNAVKFSPPERQVHVQVRAEPGFIVCAVRDEGPGLAPEEQARLFREGERLSPRPTGSEPSNGYGLAICRDLATRMGGRIWCESQPGRGTTFSFSLPVYKQEAP
jgi:signal transduction histidine kinase